MIVAVTGGKGGVGKSTVALNLARELDAVVVDADMATPDLPGASGPTLHDVLAGRVDPADAVREAGSTRVLPSGRTLDGARAADVTRLPDVLKRLDRSFEYVVVDCPAGLARDVGTAVAVADVAVLVTTPTEPAVENALRVRDLALEVGTPTGAGVINKHTDSDHEMPVDRIEDALKAPAVVVEDRSDVADAFAADEAVSDYRPDSPAADRFDELAWQIVIASDD